MIDSTGYIERIRKIEHERLSLQRALSAALANVDKVEQSLRNAALENERLKHEIARLRSK